MRLYEAAVAFPPQQPAQSISSAARSAARMAGSLAMPPPESPQPASRDGRLLGRTTIWRLAACRSSSRRRPLPADQADPPAARSLSLEPQRSEYQTAFPPVTRSV